MEGGLGALGRVLRARRVDHGLTQHELARRAGLSVRAVRDIERGRVRRPHRSSVLRLAEAVGMDAADAAGWAKVGGPSPRAIGPAGVQVAVLGPLTAYRAGRPVDVGPMKRRCLLGLLALQPNRLVRYVEIAEVLWGEHPPATFRNLVHGHVARLRKVLAPSRARGPGGGAPAIVGVEGGYRLTAQADQLDLLRFVGLTDRARAVQDEDPTAALAAFARALGWWRGPVLADLPAVLRQHPAAVAVYSGGSARCSPTPISR